MKKNLTWIEKLNWILENTDLFIELNGTDPNIVSDFGRAKSINLKTNIAKFSRQEVTAKQLGSELAWGQDIFLKTEIHLSKCTFEIIRNWSKDNGSWARWDMDNFKGKSWESLYDHLQIHISKWTKLKHNFKTKYLTKPELVSA